MSRTNGSISVIFLQIPDEKIYFLFRLIKISFKKFCQSRPLFENMTTLKNFDVKINNVWLVSLKVYIFINDENEAITKVCRNPRPKTVFLSEAALKKKKKKLKKTVSLYV